jgi:hypothetical protein
MEESIKLKFEQPELEQIRYQGNRITLKKNYLSFEDQKVILEGYAEELKTSIQHAEVFLLTALLERCTNIELSSENDGVTTASLDINDLYSHFDLIEQIRTKILNYADLRHQLDLLVICENSLKSTLELLVIRTNEFIASLPETLANLKISDEDMARMKEITESPILNEATKIFRLGYPQSDPSPTPEKTPKKAPKVVKSSRKKYVQ